MKLCLICCVFVIICLASTEGYNIQKWSRSCQEKLNNLDGYTRALEKLLTDCQLKVDGGWSVWTNWSPCSATCGTGKETRRRSCSNPAPQNRGDLCDGPEIEERKCSLRTCPGESAPASGSGHLEN